MESPASFRCAETGLALPSAAEAEACAARFRAIQEECAAGCVPGLRAGDVIYLDTELYLSHGRDDFRGGLALVTGVRGGVSAGKPADYVECREQPGSWYNWHMLAEAQPKLRANFGRNWSHPDPDYRREFNEP
jgi:hypothetical protein